MVPGVVSPVTPLAVMIWVRLVWRDCLIWAVGSSWPSVGAARGMALGLRVRSASWVTSTSSVPAPSEAVRGTGRLCAVRCCGVSS